MTDAPDFIPAPLRSLWQEAARLVVFVLHQFNRDRIRTGIKRTTGAHIAIWLGGAESALRRLILMAAMSFTPAPLKARAAHTPTPRNATTKRSFRIFHLHGSGIAHGRTSSSAHTRAPYAHIVFPADPILSLGRAPSRPPKHRHNGGPVLPRPRQRNPLDRWVRLSRNDPDWRAPPESLNAMFDYNIIPEPLSEREGDTPTRKRKPPLRHDSAADWRRQHDEWQKLVPAPTLAARLDALERALANPHALIQRTARRLASNRDHTLSLARAARPNTEPPRRARHIETTGWHSEIPHAVQAAFDSS